MRNMHKYEELTPFEFEQEKKRASIIYLTSGPLEYHEECNALGIDPCKGYEWCLAVAERVGGIVFPMLPLAPSGNPLRTREQLFGDFGKEPPYTGKYHSQPGMYPGVFSSLETCRMVFQELLETFALHLEFKMCVFMGSHGPSGNLCKTIVKECGAEIPDIGYSPHHPLGTLHGMKIMAVGSLDYNLDIIRKFYADHRIGRINHGGLWEAAINYAINPEYFQPEYLDPEKYPPMYGALKEEHAEDLLRPVRSEYRQFTPEFARELFDVTVERFAADVKQNYEKLIQK
ncbi:MAG: Creatinine amidohydrolase [Lentisphaerae bacterium ADurb.Bin242]|nr:MAG: Creatinine amidohydrolase [Lentisphaerae bacterium ADurb.Bin242]